MAFYILNISYFLIQHKQKYYQFSEEIRLFVPFNTPL